LVAVIGRVRQDAEHHTADLDERPLLAGKRPTRPPLIDPSRSLRQPI